ncbi:crotonobetainyl-CoA:carnitine CoA-transferase CaiB-like acyl-CoA transferase [Ancylobacter aquaticus]|uniref:Crotonobetainyl-CoA:carnitine CoA-transferase CaiB-like acyl-CoA transferase n=1 Tax=Ancylobacter aquaticus TaxID=100 RepID=A0A4R1I6M5_ANCAQ|nr:CaiB/BaiF CoA-transferase family protein [Ancylobacter aquaticus]TCK28329.1 crotonobetainyl-CoA:carnitine CoA-transferase CaiB-like acyl-CoA transferase [Ancylobacter aquaticus]
MPSLSADASPAGPLSGLLVVSIDQAVAGPLCSMRLADAGARVIKIEAGEGDRARDYDTALGSTSAAFGWLNRGKESVVLNLKDADDLALVKAMLSQADVFVQNLAPGASDRLGLGAAQLIAEFPRLIIVDIMGYGRGTPHAAKRAYDMLVQAESGICAVTGTPDVPSKVGISIADIGTGTNAYCAVLEALLQRERTGHGQAIEVAMFDAMAEWMSLPLLHYDYMGVETARFGLSHASVYPYRPYHCADGDIVVSIQSTAEWVRFCSHVLRLPDLAKDPRFIDNWARVQNRDALDAAVHAVFTPHGCAEMIERLEAGQIAWARVSTLHDLSVHPALRRISVEMPGGERVEMPRPAGRPVASGSKVPALGADSAAIRAEFARGAAATTKSIA